MAADQIWERRQNDDIMRHDRSIRRFHRSWVKFMASLMKHRALCWYNCNHTSPFVVSHDSTPALAGVCFCEVIQRDDR